MLIFFIILKNVKICFNPSINLVRFLYYYIDLRKLILVFIRDGVII